MQVGATPGSSSEDIDDLVNAILAGNSSTSPPPKQTTNTTPQAAATTTKSNVEEDPEELLLQQILAEGKTPATTANGVNGNDAASPTCDDLINRILADEAEDDKKIAKAKAEQEAAAKAKAEQEAAAKAKAEQEAAAKAKAEQEAAAKAKAEQEAAAKAKAEQEAAAKAKAEQEAAAKAKESQPSDDVDEDELLNQILNEKPSSSAAVELAPEPSTDALNTTDAYAEEMLNKLLTGGDGKAAASPAPSGTSNPEATGASSQNGPAANATSTTTATMAAKGSPTVPAVTAKKSTLTDALWKKSAATSEFSLEEEEQVLQAILGAVDVNVSSIDAGSGELSSDVNAVLDHAERLASSGAEVQPGGSVLHTGENHALKEEIKRAKPTAGHPLCVDVQPLPPGSSQTNVPIIAMGTTLGLVLLFNAKNKLCGICGSVALGADSKGSVVSVSFAPDGETVIAGYERGNVVLWESNTLQALKVLEEFETPVFRVSFMYPDPMKAFAVDGNGTIKLFSFATVMGKYVFRTNTVTPTFEIPANDVASISEEIQDGNEMKDMHYLACVCTDSLNVFEVSFGIQNDIDLIYSINHMPKTAKSNELVLWLYRSKPTLCVCWTVEAELFSMIHTPDGTSFAKTHTISLPTPIHAICNLEGSCVMMLDQEDSIHVVDTAKTTVAETLQLAGFEPVVFSNRSCGMKYQGSVSSGRGTGYVLSSSRILSASVLSWESRLDTLTTLKLWDEAFDLAKGIALNEAVAMVGLSEDPQTRQMEVHDYLTQMVIGYITSCVHGKPEPSQLKGIVKKMITFCSNIDALDIAYGPILTFFNNIKALDEALYCFEDALLSGAVKSLPEHVIKMFVELFNDEPRFNAVDDLPDSDLTPMQRAETALMYIDDNQEVLLAVAAEHNMRRLSCVVLSLHLVKPEAPLVTCAGGFLDIALEYLYKTIHELSLIPGVPLPQGNRRLFKETVMSFLVNDPNVLKDLMVFNVTEVLKILNDALTEPVTDTWTWKGDKVTKLQLYKKLDSLLIRHESPYNKPWEAEKHEFASYSAILLFYKMFAKQIATGGIKLTDDKLSDFVHRITWHVAYEFSKEGRNRIELQEILSELYRSQYVVGRVQFSKIERELQSKHIARALAAIYSAQEDHSSALAWYLDEESSTLDPELRGDVFKYITSTMDRLGDGPRAQPLRTAVKDHLEILVEVDATALAQFVFEYLPEDHGEVLHSLEGTSTTFFLYLKETVVNGGGAVNNDSHLQNTFIQLLCMHEPAEVYRYLVEKDTNITYDLDLALQYCREAHIVDASIFLLEKTLQISEAMALLMSSITENLEHLRENAVQRASDATKDLTRGDTSEFSFGDLSFIAPGGMKDSGRPNASGQSQTNFSFTPIDDEDAAVLRMVDVGIELCIRYQHKLDVKELSTIWFSLLDRFARPKRVLFERQLRSRELRMTRSNAISDEDCIDEIVDELELAAATHMPILQQPMSTRVSAFCLEMQDTYTKYVSYILSQMVKALDLSIVVGKIVDDNEREKFGPFKPIIVDILASLSFDLEVNRLCKICTDNDTFNLGNKLRKTLCRGVTLQSDVCASCNKHLSEQVSEFDSIRVYPCGHAFHESCCGTSQECPRCASDSSRKAIQGQEEPHRNETRKKKKQQSAAPPKDVKHIIRRLHHTKSKLDGGINYHDMLQQYLRKDSHLEENINRRLALKGLLLAPAPPLPSSIGEQQVGALPMEADFSEGLQDEEIRDLFGDEGVYIEQPPRPKKRKNQPKMPPAAGSGGLGDDDDVDLDALMDD